MSKHISTVIRHSWGTVHTTLFSSFSLLYNTPKSGIDVPDMPPPPVPPIDYPGVPPPLSPDLDGVDSDVPPSHWKRMPPDLYPPLRSPDDQPDLPPWPVEPGEL